MVTVAVNCCDAPRITVDACGKTATVTAGIVMVAEPDLVVSACDVAVTVTVFGVFRVAGVEYRPLLSTVPGPDVVQVTALLVVPFTVAVNCCVAPRITVGVAGVTLTVTTGAVMVMVAVSDLVASSRDVAFTLTVAGFGTVSGAV